MDFFGGTGAGGVGAVRGGNLKKIKKLEGGWGGGRSASPPDASLTTMMVVFVLKRLVVVVVVGHSGLDFVNGTGAGGVGALLFIVVLDFVVVLVLVVLVPCEEATLKK